MPEAVAGVEDLLDVGELLLNAVGDGQYSAFRVVRAAWSMRAGTSGAMALISAKGSPCLNTPRPRSQILPPARPYATFGVQTAGCQEVTLVLPEVSAADPHAAGQGRSTSGVKVLVGRSRHRGRTVQEP
ncbi:hypothetical protein DYI20_06290 [Auritidibacter ignavus]|nr:hypothetical protein DCC24_06085 [Auritidibacter sp. NML100628]PXA80002.1 hypothetical protein DCC26_04695 [Auritidibacter sp. NML120779]RMX23141.1 hypothetical protein DYI20_06290 [Auritidibacter ignavus]